MSIALDASTKEYLKNVRIILENEWDSLQKFYNLLSNEGSHSLEAAAEQVKVYKNVAIEWMLLVTGRLQLFLK